MPWSIAFLSAGTTALASLAEMAIASTFCEVSVLMYDTCDDALASDGPTSLASEPSALTASTPPLSEIVKYGLLTCLGRKAMFRPSLTSPPVAAVGVALDELELDELWLSSFVEPHAVTASVETRTHVRLTNVRLKRGMTLLWLWLGNMGGSRRGRVAALLEARPEARPEDRQQQQAAGDDGED